MRRKIEITPDGQSYMDSEPGLDVEEQASEHDDSAPSANGASHADGAEAKPDFKGAGVGGAEATITALQAENEELRTRAADAEKRLIYAQAEFQNAKRRMEEEIQNRQRYATGEFVKNLLPVLDNFERALKAAEQTQNYDALISGVNGTLKQLLSALQKAGITPIEAVGQEFDPNYHEAIGHTESAEFPANTVAEELQRGYIMHDRVLRPTLVKVAQG